MSEKTLKFDNIKVNAKEFYNSKQPINLDVVNVDQKEGEIAKLLCIILPKVNAYIKYSENGGKNMSFVIKDDDVLDKYNRIWDKIKETLNIKFHSMPVYDKKYIKAKV